MKLKNKFLEIFVLNLDYVMKNILIKYLEGSQYFSFKDGKS